MNKERKVMILSFARPLIVQLMNASHGLKHAGEKTSRPKLETWLPSLQKKPDVYARVEWTILRLQWGKHEPTGTGNGKDTVSCKHVMTG